MTRRSALLAAVVLVTASFLAPNVRTAAAQTLYFPATLRGRFPAPAPTARPTSTPTPLPSATGTVAPTAYPTVEPTMTPTAPPTSQPTTQPTGEPGEDTFAIEAIPTAITNSVPGQRCVFLLAVRSSGSGADPSPITLSATAPGAQVIVEPAVVVPGRVAEVKVIPAANQQEQTVPVTVRAVRGDEVHEVVASLDVLTDWPGVDEERGAYAATVRDRFVPWLQAHHPELGITTDTTWQGTIVTPQWLVVMHYLFFSPEWEMHVEWHVMIPPHDWARIDLRHRFDETKPSYAFEISSWSAETEPIPTEVPDTIWR